MNAVFPLLLGNLLGDPYFQQTAPKSTGLEYCNLQFLSQLRLIEYIIDVMVTAVLVAMIMSFVNKSFSDTQFAVLSSIDSLGRVLV